MILLKVKQKLYPSRALGGGSGINDDDGYDDRRSDCHSILVINFVLKIRESKTLEKSY